MVISTGITLPAWAWVAALYCRQKSMMFTAWGPSAVPTGGAGVAWPAVSSILMTAATRRRRLGWGGMSWLLLGGSELLDLVEGELDRGLAAEDRHQHLDRKSTRLNSSHVAISYAVFCLKKKKTEICITRFQIQTTSTRTNSNANNRY